MFLLFIVFFQLVVVLYFVSLFYQCNYFFDPEEGTGCPEKLTISVFRVIMHFQCFIYSINWLSIYILDPALATTLFKVGVQDDRTSPVKKNYTLIVSKGRRRVKKYQLLSF